jgi:SpoVK/Ycf46/Vps4 family AAA+-type ATPase
MNEQTLKLLEKALLATPGDWETRAHLLEQYLALGQARHAAELLADAPAIPETESDRLLQARVELESDSPDAMGTLQKILSVNKACAQAYLLMARVYQRRGLREEARRKYGAATVIDESLHDAELEQWLGLSGNPAAPVPATPANTLPEVPEAEDATEDGEPVLVTAEETAEAIRLLEPEQPKVTFDDIGGMTEVIERIRMNIIYPFKNPEVFKRFNKKPGGGILMYGPPGCGKTHIARATAGECGASFISIAITDILSKWLGESEQHLHQIFEGARHRAPSVIFIDEIDAIGMNRSDVSASMAPLVNVLLTEMDGIANQNESLMVLAATNTPWRIDSAMRRPGRFDRVLFVPPPDEEARKAILKICLRNLPVDKPDLDKLARLTPYYSGADLRAVVDRASEKAIFEEMKSGKTVLLSQRLLADAVKETRPSTKEWLETARSYATYANRTGLYDDLVAYFEKH